MRNCQSKRVFIAVSYKDIQAVMRTFWRKPFGTKNIPALLAKDKNYPNHPLFFNLASSFLDMKTYPNYIQELRAYFLVRFYEFILKSYLLN